MLDASVPVATRIVALVVLAVALVGYPAQALFAAWLADHKGHHFLLGFLAAALVPVLGLLAVIIAPPRRDVAS